MNLWPTLEEARSWIERGTGRGIKIAILDSGIESSHPQLAGLTLTDDVAIVEHEGLSLRVVPGEGQDCFGHGTAIAGILREIAPDAQLGSFRLLGEHLRSRSLIIREGVRQALARGYHILNCSFGCGRADHVLLYKDWVDEAYIQGRHIVASCNNQDTLKPEWPGHFPTVITVNATRCSNGRSFFCRRGHLVEFATHGEDVKVPWLGGGYKQVTGSSFAAPRMAGVLARLLCGCPMLSPLHAKALLQQLALPWQD